MAACDRRTFIKRSALLAATAAAAAAGGVCAPAVEGEAASGPEALGAGGSSAARRVSATTGSAQGTRHPFFARAKNRPEVIAHRGGALQWPGETMFAFEEALKLGADVLEMDVYQTRDGELVLMHDMTVNGTTDGRGFVNLMTLRQLKALNAGYRWTDDGGKTHRYREKNLPVATLGEVFEAFPGVRMNIEMKPALRSPVAKLCALIRARKMSDNVLVASFSHGYLREFRVHCPGVATSASPLELGQYLVRNQPLKAQAIQLKPEIEAEIRRLRLFRLRVLSEEFVRTARTKFNLQVHAWTINDPLEMMRLKEMGVDGIITDHPGRLLSVLGRGAAA